MIVNVTVWPHGISNKEVLLRKIFSERTYFFLYESRDLKYFQPQKYGERSADLISHVNAGRRLGR